MDTATAPVTFDDLEFGPHSIGLDGVRATAFYPNGYGVSVVRFNGSYGYESGKYELAVLKGEQGKFNLCYDTPITEDVEGHLSPDQVSALMRAVADLPSGEA